IAEFTAGQPGAVRLMPQMSGTAFALFLAGGLWLALWRGRARLLGLLPAAIATGLLLATPVPDVLISGDGGHVRSTGARIGGEERLVVLRETKSEFTRDNLLELVGVTGEPVPLDTWPGAQCSPDFCVIGLRRGGREWKLLMSRSHQTIEERALAAAC